MTVEDLTIHVRGGNDPNAIGEVTYVVEHESGTFFHGGDSRVADAFDDLALEFDDRVSATEVERVALLGGDEIDFRTDGDALRVRLPDSARNEHAATLRIEGLPEDVA